MKRTMVWFCALLMAVPMSQLVYVADADAQRRGQSRADRQAVQEEVDRYPNATRVSPEPETRERSQRQIRRAFDALNDERFDVARDTLQPLEDNDRLTDYERAAVYQGLAQIAYEADDDLDTAIDYWQKAVDTDALPNDTHFGLMYQIAQFHFSEENYDQALRMLDDWTRLSGENTSDAITMRGNIHYRMEQYPQALRLLEEAIAADPDGNEAMYELKMAVHYEMDDYDGAVRTLEQLIARNPDDVKHQINLAQVYIEMDQTDRAVELLQKARTEGRLTEASNWQQLYQLLAYAERPGDAAAVINEGLEAGVLTADASTLTALGYNYYFAEQIDSAIDAYTRAAAVSTDGQADQQLGHMLVDSDRYAEAREALQRAFQKGGLQDEGTAYLLLGEAELELGNRSAAKEAFEKAAGYESSRSNAQIWLQNF